MADTMARYIKHILKNYAFPCLAVVESIDENNLAVCAELDQDGEKTGVSIFDVKVPLFFAGAGTGIFCKIKKDTKVLLNFLNGDINQAVIASIFADDTPQNWSEDKLLIQAKDQNFYDVLTDLFVKGFDQILFTADGKPVILKPEDKILWQNSVKSKLSKVLHN